MMGYMMIILGLLLVQWLFVCWNITWWRSPDYYSGDSHNQVSPSSDIHLSVLIPARNEERNIQACILSVMNQQALQGRTIEVLVWDDDSEDRTAALVQELQDAYREHPQFKLRLLTGGEKPEGWMGKSYACHQLVHHAAGDWLLFLDADVRLRPDALSVMSRLAFRQEKGLITGFPYQETVSWMERLVVPLMMFFVACHLPIPLIKRSRDPRFVAAHGAFILIDRETYTRTGGHQAFKNHLVDDLKLAAAVKSIHAPVTLVNMSKHADMRMYTDARGVFKGYQKNIYPGLGRNSVLLVGICMGYTAFYLSPFMGIVTGLITGRMALLFLSLGCLLAAIGVKATVDHSQHRSIRDAWWISLSIFFFLCIVCSSWYASTFQKGYTWKGRTYR